MTGDRIKVLYIAGCQRSGSTILGNILGQVEGFTHVGELHLLWGVLSSPDVPCTCGAPLLICDRWNAVLKEAYGGRHQSLVPEMLRFRYVDNRASSLLWTIAPNGRQRLQRRLTKPLAELQKLYGAIQKVANCKVIVDSSKNPMYGYALQLMEGIDLYVLHLIRDPRAVAYSWIRKKAQPESPFPLLPKKTLFTSLNWNSFNFAIEVMGKGCRQSPLRLRYEDFVADPRGSLRRILDFVGRPSSGVPLQDEHSVNLQVQHTVAGNPSRFATGKVEIREDDEWRTRMKKRHRLLATAVTLPLLIKYGYLGGNPRRELKGRDSSTHDPPR